MDAFLDFDTATWSTRRFRLKRLYDYYNGIIDDEDYRYVTNPYGKSRNNFPSKLRNYNIIKPTIDLLLGEKAKRPFNYSVVAVNSDSVDRKEAAQFELVRGFVEQGIVNELNAAGLDTGVESEEIPLSENLKDMFERTYVDNEAILGQKALTYIQQQEEIHDKLQKAWFHFLVAGECYSERSVRNNEVNYDILNPLDMDYDLDPDLDFVEDSDWTVVTRYMGPAAIVKNWGRFMTQAQIDALWDGSLNDSLSILLGQNRDRQNINSTLIMVRTVYWQSLKRIGFLTYQDPETGEFETTEVPDGFVLDPILKEEGAELEWEWHNQAWQGIRIGEDIDIDVRPVKQREFIDNPSNNKLPINGRQYSAINSDNISLVELGIPFQLNYNIYKYRLETSIARSKDIIAQLDINLIPKGWDMDKFMYFVEGTGIAWVDYNKEGVKLQPTHQTVMDLSIKTIQSYIVLLDHIQMEWENLSGINRQRRGEVGQYQGKAIGQQAIVQSSHITEDLYRKFAQFERRDLQMILEITDEAWINGKKGSYIMPDGAVDYFTLEPGRRLSDLGVFVTDATKEVEKMNLAKELAIEHVRQQGKVSTALDLVDGESFLIIKEKVKKAEQMEAQLAQAQQEAEMAARQQAEEKDMALKDREFSIKEQELMIKESEGQKERDLKRELAYMEMNEKATTKDKELTVKEKEMMEKERANKAAEEIKDKDISAKKEIASKKTSSQK